jgi:nitrogen regulatory protein PII
LWSKTFPRGRWCIHARGLASEEVQRFLAITIQPEKDIVLIVAPHEKNHAIMESITKEVGLGSEARGICFSLPVSKVIGLTPSDGEQGVTKTARGK